MTLALAVAWALVFVGAAWPHRPAPARVRALRRGNRSRAPGGEARPTPTEWLGGVVLRQVARRADPSPRSARRLGRAVATGLACLLVLPAASVPLGLAVWAAPGVAGRRAERRRLAALSADLPDVVDLLALGVSAGLTVHLAVERVSERGAGPLAAELRRIVEEVRLGRRLADALEGLPGRAGEAMRPLVAALVSAERYGAPLVGGLERLADEVRRDRRRRAEEAARKLPVKLLFPLVVCTLPAFGLLTVAPLIASAVRSLRL